MFIDGTADSQVLYVFATGSNIATTVMLPAAACHMLRMSAACLVVISECRPMMNHPGPLPGVVTVLVNTVPVGDNPVKVTVLEAAVQIQ